MSNVIEINGKRYMLKAKKTRGRKRKDSKIQLWRGQFEILKRLHVLPIPGWVLSLEEIK